MKVWLRFNAVGIGGACLQLASLWFLTRFGVHYLWATALSVEAALLHNFWWHIRWTWRGREASLLRFHLANGLLSFASNLVLMRIFTGWLAVPAVAANLFAIILTSLLNFVLGDRWVFAERPGSGLHGGAQRIDGEALDERADDETEAKGDVTR